VDGAQWTQSQLLAVNNTVASRLLKLDRLLPTPTMG
jgi:hypothetical protein